MTIEVSPDRQRASAFLRCINLFKPQRLVKTLGGLTHQQVPEDELSSQVVRKLLNGSTHQQAPGDELPTQVTQKLVRDPATQHGIFQYKPLDHNVSSIRLLQVLPNSSPEGYIQCTMQHADICAEYTCLSYVWGPPDEGQCILLNGRKYMVRRNLFDFLTVAQRRHKYKFLWIDALCIDQRNIAERNHQVQQMGNVFSNAIEVLAWFGKDKDITAFIANPAWDHSRGFTEFVLSSYWRRAWITQEIMLAKSVKLCAGFTESDPLTLWVKTKSTNTQNVTHPPHPLGNLVIYTNYLKGASLIRLLATYGAKDCLLRRDRIYSLLAVCGEGSDLRVDYEASEEQVLLQTLRSCSQSLCFCSAVHVAAALGYNWPPESVRDSSSEALYLDIVAKKPAGKPTWTSSAGRTYGQCWACNATLYGGSTAVVACLRSVCDLMPPYHLAVKTRVTGDGRKIRHYFLDMDDRPQSLEARSAKLQSSGIRLRASTTKADTFYLCLSLWKVLELGKSMAKRGLHFWYDKRPLNEGGNHMRLCEHGCDEG